MPNTHLGLTLRICCFVSCSNFSRSCINQPAPTSSTAGKCISCTGVGGVLIRHTQDKTLRSRSSLSIDGNGQNSQGPPWSFGSSLGFWEHQRQTIRTKQVTRQVPKRSIHLFHSTDVGFVSPAASKTKENSITPATAMAKTVALSPTLPLVALSPGEGTLVDQP